jgi:hypothetical protein
VVTSTATSKGLFGALYLGRDLYDYTWIGLESGRAKPMIVCGSRLEIVPRVGDQVVLTGRVDVKVTVWGKTYSDRDPGYLVDTRQNGVAWTTMAAIIVAVAAITAFVLILRVYLGELKTWHRGEQADRHWSEVSLARSIGAYLRSRQPYASWIAFWACVAPAIAGLVLLADAVLGEPINILAAMLLTSAAFGPPLLITCLFAGMNALLFLALAAAQALGYIVFGYLRLRHGAPLRVKAFLIIHGILLPLAFIALYVVVQADMSRNFPDIPLGP